MTNLKKRVAYLQGLAEGMDIDDGSKEGRILAGIIDVLGEMAEQIEDIEAAQSDLEDYVESIDEDLYNLEGDMHGADIEEYMEVECPNCGQIVCFDAGIVDDEDLIEVTCPNCDEVVYVNDEEILDDTEDVVLEAGNDNRMVSSKDTEDI
ncbi:CD1247 N-terminal domain-containing protein [Thermincola ferriacetica]